jgi:ABC-2 type transport system permease protein
MTSSTVANQAFPRRRALPEGRVTQLRLVRSEWTKLWSLRSTRWSLLVAFIAQAGLPILFAAIRMSHWGQMSPMDRASFNSIEVSADGWRLSQLAIGVLGVLVISGEYSTGMIRSSVMAVPRRLPVVWAKLAVFAVVTLVLMALATFISFFGVQAVVAEHHVQHTLSDPAALRVLFGTALYLTVLGMLCTGLGTLLRNTAGGIAAFVFLILVLPGLVEILPARTAPIVNKYLPSTAGERIASVNVGHFHMPPWGGLALFAGYAAAVVAAAAAALRCRDA